MDPALEREMALKQLLELPTGQSKKSPSVVPKKVKRPPGRPPSTKVSPVAKSDTDSKAEKVKLDSSGDGLPKKNKKALKENNSQNAKNEELRSGRKRKPTEKAREHELIVKRQKVIKGKIATDSRKSSQEESGEVVEQEGGESDLTSVDETEATTTEEEGEPTKPEAKSSKAETKVSPAKTESKEQIPVKTEEKPSVIKGKMTPVKRPKIGLIKKNPPISKRKLAVKNLIRQKMTSKKAVAGAKAKVQV